MEAKKSHQADLEPKKVQFFEIGMVTVLAFLLVAFEWSTSEIEIKRLVGVTFTETETDVIPITRRPEPKLPIPEPPIKKQVTFEVVVDNTAIETEVEIETTEFSDAVTAIDYSLYEDDADELVKETIVHTYAEEMPEFPGGRNMLMRFIADKVNYPEEARALELEGKVIVQFVVNEKGKIEDISIARGVDPLLDAAAMEVIGKLPKWKPGKQRGKAVKVSYTLPINFILAR